MKSDFASDKIDKMGHNQGATITSNSDHSMESIDSADLDRSMDSQEV